MNKKYLLAASLVVGALIGLYQYKKYRVPPHTPFETLICNDTLGNKVSLASFKGKKVILTYFATWCGDCLREMKQLNEMKKTNLQDVEVIAISDEHMQKITAFAVRKKYPFTFWQLPYPFAQINVYAIPVTYLINTKGEVVYSKVGALNWNDPTFVTYVEKSLE